MTLGTILKRLRKSEPETTPRFSDFFLHASDGEKKKVLTEAAHRANEAQMRVYKKARVSARS